MVEHGYTRAYSRISDVGLARYFAYFALYMVSVEFFVYWQHRGLHDVKLGYRCGPAPSGELGAKEESEQGPWGQKKPKLGRADEEWRPGETVVIELCAWKGLVYVRQRRWFINADGQTFRKRRISIRFCWATEAQPQK